MALATATVALLSFLALCGYATWAMNRVDREAEARERASIRSTIDESYERFAEAQRSVVVWDESVERTRAGDQTWMEDNLGLWLGEFYGFDDAVVFDPGGRPVQAMLDGATQPAERARPLAEALAPSIRDLRARMAADGPEGRAQALVQGAASLRGTPVLFSLTPILPDDEGQALPEGAEFLHVVVRRLDGDFLAGIGEHALVQGLSFSAHRPAGAGFGWEPFADRDGAPVGYAVWKLDQPGRRLIAAAAPGIAAGGAAAVALLAFLNLKLRRAAARLEASEAQARHLAFHDPLTGLPNRALFDERLAEALEASRRDGLTVALHYVDLDHFKNVNDTLGHAAGDELVRAVASRFSNAVREEDTVARIGGDEFAVIQTGLRSAKDAERLGLRLVSAASHPFRLLGEETAVGASVGIALAPDDASRCAELMRRADIALYEAKQAGRGGLRFFSGELEEALLRKRIVEHDLRQALDEDEGLDLAYQPVMAADGRTLLGAEALLRWDHPRHGEIPPSVFVPVAEERGLIQRLGAWALERACADAVRLNLPWVAVNVAPRQLREPRFVDDVLAILHRTGLAPSRLQIEATENALIGPAEVVAASFRRLRRAGVVVALDDFGAGFSSLHYLRDYQVDKIKIDRSFVQHVSAADAPEPIIRAMVELGRSLGLRVSAEGVETAAQWASLAGFGCQEFQGFHFASPCRAADFAAWTAPARAAG